MKINQWTLGLAAAGVISFGAVAQADEKPSQQVLTAVSSTTLSGYISTSAHWNPGKVSAQPGYSYSAGKSDGFNLDVVDIKISKPLDEGQWSAGYVAEMWLGPDAAPGSGLGGNNLSATVAGNGSIALKQAYVALNIPVGNGIIVKMGAFDTPIGYESANSPDNPNYTRSYGNSLETTEHTGIIADYKVCDMFSVTAGVANSRTPSLVGRTGAAGGGAGGAQSEKTYMGGFSLTAPESLGFLKGAVLTAGFVDGRATGSRPGAAPDVSNFYLGATVPTPWETLKTGVSWDHLQVAKKAGFLSADADSIAFYASFTGIQKLKLNARVEYLDNGSGAIALGGAGVGKAGVAGDSAAEVLATTLTADYQLWGNVISRLEYRWDHDLSGGRHLPGNLNGVTGAASIGANNAQLVALNIIYKF